MSTQTQPVAGSNSPAVALNARAIAIAAQQSITLSHYTQAQQDAILQLYHLVKRHNGTSGGTAAAKLLLGLYNGRRFPFDLTDFRLFDAGNFNAAMTVLQMDARHTWCEIHILLNAILGVGKNTGAEFEHWAYNLRLPKRCKKDQLPVLVRSGGAV